MAALKKLFRFGTENSDTVHKDIQGAIYKDIFAYATDDGAVLEISHKTGDSINLSFKPNGYISITRKHNGLWLPEIKLADAWT